VREKFERLESLDFGETPHFVFAHILSPHWPFVFDAKGEAVYPTVRYRLEANFPSWEGPTLEEFTAGYAEQLQAVNAMTLHALDGLLAKNPNTIVILQGDHGTRRSMHAGAPFSLEKRAREEHAILNAFRFPDGEPPATIKRTITSVNTFRVLFDELFEANLGLLDPKFFMFDPSEDEVDHDVTKIINRVIAQ
jgi:phosphoglycerol transferase MdoB-like AlkP superfamily enzyme